jgi:hypothetical protein
VFPTYVPLVAKPQLTMATRSATDKAKSFQQFQKELLLLLAKSLMAERELSKGRHRSAAVEADKAESAALQRCY